MRTTIVVAILAVAAVTAPSRLSARRADPNARIIHGEGPTTSAVRSTGQKTGVDVTGQWTRESGDSRWGSRVQIDQSGISVLVRPASGPIERFKLDGSETAEVLSTHGCKATIRIAKATAASDHLIITTWLVTKAACVHGEDEDDPMMRMGIVAVSDVRGGPRKIESITAVYREGNTMTVEVTGSSGGGTTTTTTTYRK